MANAEQLAILKQGVKVWNEWREKNKDVRPDLGSGAYEPAGACAQKVTVSQLLVWR
jgi:hypothetical protein